MPSAPARASPLTPADLAQRPTACVALAPVTMEATLGGWRDAPGPPAYIDLLWTAMARVNAISRVCDAAPGFVSHLDLGLFKPPGLVRV